jgi:hypothetical protein
MQPSFREPSDLSQRQASQRCKGSRPAANTQECRPGNDPARIRERHDGQIERVDGHVGPQHAAQLLALALGARPRPGPGVFFPRPWAARPDEPGQLADREVTHAEQLQGDGVHRGRRDGELEEAPREDGRDDAAGARDDAEPGQGIDKPDGHAAWWCDEGVVEERLGVWLGRHDCKCDLYLE